MLTVVLINKNESDIINRQLNAVDNQTTPPYEFIIIDDGSTDESKNVIEDFAINTRIKTNLRLHNKSIGFNNRANEILNDIKTKYVIFVSSHDYFLPDFVQEYSSHLDKDYKLIVSTPVNESGEFGITGHSKFILPGEALQAVYTGYPVWGHTACLDVNLVKETGGHIKVFLHHADWFLTHSTAFRYGYYYIGKVLAKKTVRPGSQSHGMDGPNQPAVKKALYEHINSGQFEDIKPQLLNIMSWIKG